MFYNTVPSIGEFQTIGGQVVLQRNVNQGNFNRTWLEYKAGFGQLCGDYWLGNENLHKLTTTKNCSMLVNLQQKVSLTWSWENFRITVRDETSKYHWNLTDLGGNSGYDLLAQSDKNFTTLDQDNLLALEGNCAVIKDAGWWYGTLGGQCSFTNLNAHGNDFCWRYIGNGDFLKTSCMLLTCL